MGVLIDDIKRFVQAHQSDVARLEDKFFELLEAHEVDRSAQYYDPAMLVLGAVFDSLDLAERERQRGSDLDDDSDLDEIEFDEADDPYERQRRALRHDSRIKVWNMARRQLGVEMAQGDGLPYPKSFKLKRDPGVAETLRLVVPGPNGLAKSQTRRERNEDSRRASFDDLVEDGWFHFADKEGLTVRPKRPVPWRCHDEPPEPLDARLGGLPRDEQLVIRLWGGHPVGGCLFDVRTIRRTVQACGFSRQATQQIMARLANTKVGDKLPTARFSLTQIGMLLQFSKHDTDQLFQRGLDRVKEMLVRQYRVP